MTAVLPYLAVGVAAAVSYLLARWLIAWAPRLGFVDRPSGRGMHGAPVARVGGIAVGPAMLVGGVVGGAVPGGGGSASLAGGALIWAIGVADDRWRLSARYRLAAQAVAVLMALPSLPVALPGPPWPWWMAALLGWLWCINLHNFMDGIDGIAGVQALTVLGGMAGVLALQGGGETLPLLVAAAAFAGFLVLNWPPARLFLGDGGSTLLGYLVGLGTAAAVLAGSATAVAWFLLSAVFFTDATVTLLRRIATGQDWHTPHRLHAYQKLALHWGSHGRVSAVVAAINVFWLFPLALLAVAVPAAAPLALALAYAPLLAVTWWLGAGLRPW